MVTNKMPALSKPKLWNQLVKMRLVLIKQWNTVAYAKSVDGVVAVQVQGIFSLPFSVGEKLGNIWIGSTASLSLCVCISDTDFCTAIDSCFSAWHGCNDVRRSAIKGMIRFVSHLNIGHACHSYGCVNKCVHLPGKFWWSAVQQCSARDRT